MRVSYTKILSQLVFPRGRAVINFNGATKGNAGREENGGLYIVYSFQDYFVPGCKKILN